jgi:hypothetical protein
MNIGVGVIGWGAIAEQCRRYVAQWGRRILSRQRRVLWEWWRRRPIPSWRYPSGNGETEEVSAVSIMGSTEYASYGLCASVEHHGHTRRKSVCGFDSRLRRQKN